MPNLMKINMNDVNLHQAVEDEKYLPIKDNQIKDARYCKIQALFYMFNGARWIPIELV